ncbi:MAG TPA: tetratricopeptide repeat protein [Thermoanaerobaculia bacterium]|jgi:tetratricopeptide (TPR) repeat protein|nr:tetratricopeptide repeat protein [Thermoanaerobaculia bacterium]
MAIQREQVVQTAEKYVSRGKIEPAIREYRKLLTDNPNDINTLNRIGDLYARIQRIDEAVDFFTQIAEQYSTEGFFVKAIAIYKKIIKLDPTRLEVYEKLAELYHRQGLVNEARTQYQVLADYYQKHDNAASAIAIYQKMADLEPNNPSYHVKLAEIYQSQQLIEKAMNEYRVIAEMMIAHGRAQDAAQVYERALDIDSSSLGFINDAVFKLKEAGAVSAASRFLAIAAERNPQAARIGRLARVDEPAAAEPASVPAAPVAAAPRPVERAPEPPRYTPPPPPPAPVEEEIEDVPYGGGFADQAWEEDDLAAAVRAAAPVAEPEEPQEHEIELDLDEVFVLDMDGDDEPASLVKPPPDMLTGTGSRLGSAWKAEGDDDAAVGFAEPPPAALEEMEIDLGEIGSGLPPLQAFQEIESFDMGGLPPLDAGLEGSDTGEIVLDLDEDLPQIDSSSWAVELEPAAEPSQAPVPARAPAGIDPDLLERTAAELNPENLARDEDLVSEAEVLAKYGLEEKAMERLREALRLQPRNLSAYAAMVQIHLDKGRHDHVVELANTMSRTAAEIRDAQVWPKTRRQLLEAGYRLDGDRVVADPHARIEEPAPAPEPAAPVEAVEEVGFSHLPDIDLELAELDAMAPAPPVYEEPTQEEPAPQETAPPPVVPPPAAQRKRSSVEIDQVLRGLLDPKPKRPAAARPAAPAPAAPVAPMNQAPPPPQAAPEPPAPPAAAGPMIFNPLEIGAMIESEDFDWEPPSGPPSSFMPPPPPSPVSGQALPQNLDDTGGLSWLDEADRNRPGKGAAGTAANTVANTDRLFDDEDDFFDLAAELEQELSEEDLFKAGEMPSPQAEQSLEEIVEGFKKGVSEHLSPTDYDTHFNLGIAYREMGLLDEAIGEFQVAAKDAGHLVLCCSMLGLCFLDKGLPELAVKWYKRGLESPGLSEEDNLGLLYDLGCAYLVVDDTASAYKAFVDLYGINNTYRDVVARIEELGR